MQICKKIVQHMEVVNACNCFDPLLGTPGLSMNSTFSYYNVKSLRPCNLGFFSNGSLGTPQRFIYLMIQFLNP